MNKAIITIGETKDSIEVTTNGISAIKFVYALDVLQKHFAQQLVKEAQRLYPGSPKAQEAWLDRVSKDEYQGKEPPKFNLF